MKKKSWFILPIFTVVVVLAPICAIANDGTLDEMAAQIESTGTATGNGFAPGAPTITLDDLRQAQSEQAAAQTATNTQQPYYEQWNDIDPPNPIDTASGRINSTLDTNRLIDPVTGRIDGVIDGVTGRVNGAINRTLDGLLSPVDGAIDRTFDNIDDYIDKTIASIMAPVDNAINDVMSSIDGWIEDWIGDTVGGVIDEVSGGLFGGIFGSGSKIEVEPAYDPISPLSSIITATSFQAELEGMSAPYTEAIPFAMGSMGLPDYSKIMPTLDALAKGENGNPNARLQGLDRFSTTPETLKMSLSGEVERLASRSIAQATLSEAGQEDMKSRLEGAEKTLETIIAIGDSSQDLDVTQDVMKSLSAQLANDSVLRAGQYEQDLRARQQAAADAIVNTEIARLLGEQNRARRADIAANATMMHNIVGQLHLPGEMPDDE